MTLNPSLEKHAYEGNYVVSSCTLSEEDHMEQVFTERRDALEAFEACIKLRRIATLSQLIKHNWRSDIEKEFTY